MAKQKVDKVALEIWNRYVTSMNKDVSITPKDTYLEREKKRKELEANPTLWMSYFFENYTKAPFAQFQKKAIQRITSNPSHYEVLSWARSLAKSTITSMCVIYLVLTGKKKNILLISNSQNNAIRLLDPYRATFDGNARIAHYYGKQKGIKTWTAEEFTTACGASFRAVGAGQSPRGAKNEEYRPDTLLIDDIDTDEECRNIDTINNKWDWFEQAVYGTNDPAIPLLVVFAGNIISKDCCITRAGEKADSWDIVNIRDQNGISSWIEKNSEADIDRLLDKISLKSAQKEYFNNPLVEGETFKELSFGKIPKLTKFQFLVSYSDPSTSNKDKQKKGTSYKSNVLLGYLNGIYYVIKALLDQAKNAEFVEWNYIIRDYVNDKSQVLYYIENNSLQDPFYEQVYIPLFEELGRQRGFIGITPDTRKKPGKYIRIEGTLEPLNRLKKLVFNEDEKEDPHMKRLAEQFMLINPQMKSPADGVDAVEGAVFKLNELVARHSISIQTTKFSNHHKNTY